MKSRVSIAPYLYIAPHLLFFTGFILIPLFGGLLISLNRWSIYRGRETFVGLKYYLRLFDFDFTRTQYFWKSLWVTLQFIVYYLPVLLVLSLALALLLHHCSNKLVRACAQFSFLVPSAIAVSVVAVVWRWI